MEAVTENQQQDGDAELTIDELAQHTGMTVRNIRAHQSRGLLPAPTVKGRIGYYDRRHIARLELIQQLQAGGFNLTAIQRLVERAEQTGENIGNLRSLVLTPFGDEQAEVVDLFELASQLGVEIDSRMLDKAIEIGFILPIGDNRFEILSPTIMRAGIQALQLGVPLETLFEVLQKVAKHTRAVADVFTKMVDDGIVRPVEKDGFPPERLPEVIQAIEALRPLAAEVMLSAFQVKMNDAAEDTFGRVLARIAKEDSRAAKHAKNSGNAKGTAKNGSSGRSSRSRRR